MFINLRKHTLGNAKSQNLIMKNIYLLRHCQAESAFGGVDKQRDLSAHGKAEGEALGHYLRENNIVFDHVLCSSAQRTSETLDRIIHGGAEISGTVNFVDALYNASAGDMFEVIKQATDDSHNLLIVAHNPGIQLIANMLIDSGDESLISRQAMFCAPGTMSMIKLPIERWADIELRSGVLFSWIDTDTYIPSNTPSNLL